MDQWKELGDAIRTARINRNLSQEYLSELLDVTPTHIRHIESGHRRPSIELLFQLARTLDLSLDALIHGESACVRSIHTQGLTEEEAGALGHIADLLRNKE